jgi:hypothetical protein
MTALWQVTNGKNFAQLIFSGSNLIDCEFLKDGGQITNNFVEKFVEDFSSIKHQRSGHAKHHQYHESSNLESNGLYIKSNFTLIYLKKLQEIPEHFLQLMNLKTLKKKCNQLHKRIRHNLQTENAEDDEEMEDADFGSENENANGRYKKCLIIYKFSIRSTSRKKIKRNFCVEIYHFIIFLKGLYENYAQSKIRIRYFWQIKH